MRKIDLHIHSNYSDGSNSIKEIIQAAINQGIEELSITDHMNVFGHFLFSRNKNNNSLSDYLKDIAYFQKKYENIIKIYPGAEISEDFLNISHSNKIYNFLQENLEFFSLFLIEGTFIQEPILTALNMRKYLDEHRLEHIPVILAHPRYSSMNLRTFQILFNHNIGFELNEDKLDERDASYFLEFIKKLTPMQKKGLKLSLGSDSHQVENVGNVEFITSIIEKHSLWKYVINPPKVQDYLVI
jgi:histidinol phosphatase-like PHP family hydrolase